MIITISGLPGSGTTTVSKRLQKLTGFHYVSAGSIFREMATEKKMTLEDFGKLADSDLEIDKDLDSRICSLVNSYTGCRFDSQSLILEGRLAAQSVKTLNPESVLTVLIQAPDEIRYLRIAERDGLNFEDALELTSCRESFEKLRHMENYNENIDSQNYDLIINSEKLSAERIADIIFSALPAKIIHGCLVI